jgi:Zn-dependent protease
MDLASLLYTLSYAAVPVIFAITVHEVAHGWVARKFGDRTAEAQGRLTLNPIRHIDPIGTVLVPALMLWFNGPVFGWARPVPVDSRNLSHPRRDLVLVSAAGPAVNIAMAIAWAFLLSLSQSAASGTASEWIAAMSSVGIIANVALAVFNMLPIPPLDGGRVLTNLLPAGPVSRFLERMAPFGFVIVIVLVASEKLTPLISVPIEYLVNLLVLAFGLRT